MADMSNYYPARHAPSASIDQNPDWFGRTRVGTISRPALDSDVSGTGSMLSGVHKGSNRGPQAIGSASSLESPLDTAAHTDIISTAGLGRRAPDGKNRGEQMSDASPPTQTVKSLPDGSFVHHRRNPSTGSVNSNPIGSGRNPLDDYEHLNYESPADQLRGLQQRLGTPPEVQAQIGGAVRQRLSGLTASQIPNYFAGG